MYNLKHEAIMYIENDEFGEWMQKLYAKLEELCKDVRVLRNADRVLPEDDNLLDNQDLCPVSYTHLKVISSFASIYFQSIEISLVRFGYIYKSTN